MSCKRELGRGSRWGRGQELFEWYETFSDVERQDRNINAIRLQRLKGIAMLKSQLNANPRGSHWVKSNSGLEY